ncbi:MAG: HDOD domain-containing protein [Treponema sp.]|uniref:HDOD domain-containing protein n=1 Tax=Treponema sp. TaxID=166 RepID=UPI0025EAC4B5|nr:HDOD domain-containing protein [Treponema sp.]MBQ9282439.1 HDOD domain-containing protein [Treponema sp.]
MQQDTKTPKVSLDNSKIKMAIRAGIPLSITTYTLPREMSEYMEQVLTAFLSELGQDHMGTYLRYCLNELVTNAKKANTKRIYFKEKNLDLFDDGDYELGMKTFKEETLNNIRHYLAMQKLTGLYVKLILQTRNNRIKIEVRNNSELTFHEYKRMHDKLSRAQQYTSVDQAMTQVVDLSEGAGLGIVIMILMLEKIGLTEENFQILCENGETITRIILPINEKTQRGLTMASHEFIKLIDEIPQFRESIMRVNRLISDANTKMSEIAMAISSDVSLTTDLLKLVNSVTFALASPCRSIADAVKLVGIRGIKGMLLSVGSAKNLEGLGGASQKMLWTHAYRVAFYSYNLARNFCASDRDIIDDSYVCGLLHDMGKLVFATAHPDFVENIADICRQRNLSPEIFEKLLAGVNHGEVGALIAEKWNFPDIIISVIRHHHEPDMASPATKKLTSIVYLADMLSHYETHEVDYYQFDLDVLRMFGIGSEAQLGKISEKLSAAFKAD